MSADTQDHRRSLELLADGVDKYLRETNTPPKVIAVEPSFYDYLQVNYLGELYPTAIGLLPQDSSLPFMGIPLKRTPVSSKELFTLYKDADQYLADCQEAVIHHRLATNGEWFARGKSSEEREKILVSEAEEFGEMCAGYSLEVCRSAASTYIQKHPVAGPE